MCAASVRMMYFSIVGSLSASFSRNGTKVRSTIIIRSSAWLIIQAICSGNSRGFTVWKMAPIPAIPYQASTWRQLFQASVAIRSPTCTLSAARRLESRSALWRTCAYVVRCIGPSTDRDTTSRSPCWIAGVIDEAGAAKAANPASNQAFRLPNGRPGRSSTLAIVFVDRGTPVMPRPWQLRRAIAFGGS